MSDQEVLGWLALRTLPGMGDRGLRRLMGCYDSSQSVLSASKEDLIERAGLPHDLAKQIKKIIPHRVAGDEARALHKAGIRIMTLKDPDYPRSLSAIQDPPLILYVKGTLLSTDQQAVAIVGSRKASTYGIKSAEKISSDLAACGFTIVSGLASGIDTAAHRAALAAGGRTFAVLGCGLEIPYPRENVRLREEIAGSGAVFTELPMRAQPLPGHFPYRNRIISGLAMGTLVVEAAERSGSLITAQYALEQGREVFAIPGNVGTPNSLGTNRLIKAGAKLVEEVGDILEELLPQIPNPRQVAPRKKPVTLEPIEAVLYDLLSDEPRHIDELVNESRLPSAQVTGVLLQLELKGNVKHLSGHLYVRS